MEVDKVPIRLDLPEKVKGTTDERIQYNPERLQGVLKMADDKSGWGKPEGPSQGILAYFCHNSHVAEVTDVQIENGTPVVKKVTCVVDGGTYKQPFMEDPYFWRV